MGIQQARVITGAAVFPPVLFAEPSCAIKFVYVGRERPSEEEVSHIMVDQNNIGQTGQPASTQPCEQTPQQSSAGQLSYGLGQMPTSSQMSGAGQVPAQGQVPPQGQVPLQGQVLPMGQVPPAGQVPPMGQPVQQPVVMPMRSEKHGAAIASMVLGIVAAVFCWFGMSALISVVCGIIAVCLAPGVLKLTKNRPEFHSEHTMAMAGIILGAVALAISVVSLLITMVFVGAIFGTLSSL